MPAPVINTTQSVLECLQGQAFNFQPAATNSPTGWTASPLPGGLALDAPSGLISGTPNAPGVFLVYLRATNGTGTSEPELFTFGVEATFSDPTTNTVELVVDLATRDVRSLAKLISAAVDAFLFSAKRGDQLVFRIQFVKGGVANAISLSALKIALKELDGDPVLVTGTAMHSLGAGAYLLYLDFSGAALDGALANYESDDRTSFPGKWELEWTADNTTFHAYSPAIGGATVKGSSRTFLAEVVRDLIP